MSRHIYVLLLISLVLFTTSTYAKNIQLSDEQKAMFKASSETMSAQIALLEDNQSLADAHMQKAIFMYDEIINKNSENIRAFLNRGQAKEAFNKGSGKSDLEQVIKLSSKKIQQNPDNGQLFYFRSSAYRSMKKYPSAISDMNTAISLNPKRENWKNDLRMIEIEAR